MQSSRFTPSLACFVSPHGFGHAARASGVMLAVREQAEVSFEIFTTVPRWFFEASLGASFAYHAVTTDVGFAQSSALHIDLAATVAALDDLLPYEPELIDELARAVVEAGCSAVLCDIAPMGVAVAERAGLPSILVESFTWPWLYEPYLEREPRLREHATELGRWLERADVHIQTEPLCEPRPGVLRVGPISRPPRADPLDTRDEYGVDPAAPLVIVTMGGYGERMDYLDRLRAVEDVTFVITGAQETTTVGNLRLLAAHERIYMPDLMHAADGLVSKLGYGVIAEAWREGLPFARVSRKDFREMPPLEAFVDRELPGFEIEQDAFADGAWADRIPDLLELPGTPHRGDAPTRVAAVIADRMSLESASR